MKLAETLESIRVCDDDKARRILNVSTERANIGADEIERGVTIERLANIGVPVFRYATQVTIHGTIPDFAPEARPMGYKAIFRNQNGSLGVKYIAIDGTKKKLLVQACQLADKPQFHASLNSQGLELVYSTIDREQALAAFRAFPKELIIGGLYAARGIYGEYFVVADIGAIEERNVWPLIGRLYGFDSQADLDAEQSRQDTQRAADRAKWEAEQAIRDAQRQAQNELRMSQTLGNLGLPKLAKIPTGDGAFVRVNDQGEPWLYVLKRKGPALCYTARPYVAGMTASAIGCNTKMKRWKDKLPYIQKSFEAGRLFACP